MEKYPILNERLFLRSPSINVCFRAIIEGTFEKTEIEEAFKKVWRREVPVTAFHYFYSSCQSQAAMIQ